MHRVGNPVVTERLVAAALAITLSARSRHGLPADELRELNDALAACTVDWTSLPAIPRAAVNVLVDLQPSLLASAELYEDDTRQEMMRVIVEIGESIRNAVGV